MKVEELLIFLQHLGKDPSQLIFEDELTGLYNRRFLLNYFQHKVAWGPLQTPPLSLIMMDLDHFKAINDNFGHSAGDRVLVWLARLLREVSGDEGLPIRYAGDEFMILLPQSGKPAAFRMGELLLQRLRQESPPPGEEGNGPLRISVSLGVAAAPQDAQSARELIQKADTALYCAKKQGRDRLADAAALPLEDVSAKAALFRLQGESIAGRQEQLAQVSHFLKSFSQGRSHLILAPGGPGMGKTAFLETVRRSLPQDRKLRRASAGGSIQEMFRPYYLATKLLVELLNQREDRGLQLLQTLTSAETACLSQILPHLATGEEPPRPEEESSARQGLFNALLRFIPKVVEDLPLVLLIDDLQFADEASLLLLRHLLLRGQAPLFACCAVADPLPAVVDAHRVPLEGFLRAYQQELNLTRVKLTPLTAAHIGEHLQRTFPRVEPPENFAEDLQAITQGNPLFLGELLCQLVRDQKIRLSGREWVVDPLAKDDRPESLEALIRQKIRGLDEESRRLLHQASAFGESVPLSLLTGSSRIGEAEVLEFVDRAVGQGLMKADFQGNDQNLRFRGKRILEILEEEALPEEKRDLHERVGRYQEALFQKFLFPSAAPLIYHFRKADNLEKVKAYEKFEKTQNLRIFNPVEASRYAGERRKELPPPGDPLDPESLAQVPSLIKGMLTALRNVQLYPPGSESVTAANRQVKDALDALLEKNENLTFFQVNQALMINGQKADVSEFKFAAEELLKLFDRLEIQGLLFHQGLTLRETALLLETFGRPKAKMLDRDYWHRFSEEQNLLHIELKQVRYTLRVEEDGQVNYLKIFQPIPGTPPGKGARLLAGLEKLEHPDLAQVPEVLRNLLNAAKNVKLYPMANRNVSASIDQLLEALRLLLAKRSALALAQVRGTLVVNGVKVNPEGIEPLMEGFLKFLDSNLITSLTFLQDLPLQELRVFAEALGKGPGAGLDPEYWQRLAREQKLEHILFDQICYETRITPTQESENLDQIVEIVGVEGLETVFEPIPEDRLEAFLQAMEGRLADLLAEGREREVSRMFHRLLADFSGRPIVTREKIVETCRRRLEELTPALQNFLAKVLAGPLLEAFPLEKDPKITRTLASLLHRMATLLIQFAQYPLAGRLLLSLRRQQKRLEDAEDPYSQRLAKLLDRKLDPGVQELLLADLSSEESFRRQNALFLLGALGRAAAPLLVEAIKRTEDLRIRTLAAGLLAKTGSGGVSLLKREAVLGGAAEERARILEVIDLASRDLKAELAHALGEEDPRVRRAGFHLLERLNDSQTAELLLDYARGNDLRLAEESIELLGKLKPAAAAECLLSLLENQKKTDLRLACCRALGQIADPVSIGPLARIVTRQGLFSRLKTGWAEVRAAAALALAQIPHPRAAEVFLSLENDPDPRVREAAQKFLKSAPAPTPPPRAGRLPRKAINKGQAGSLKKSSPLNAD